LRRGDYFPNQWDGGEARDVDAEHDHENQEASTYAKFYPQRQFAPPKLKDLGSLFNVKESFSIPNAGIAL